MSPMPRGPVLGLGGFGLFPVADATIKHLGGDCHAVQIGAFAGPFALPMIGLMWLRRPVSRRPVHPWLMALRSSAFPVLPGSYLPMPVQDLATVAAVSASGMAGTLLMLADYTAAPPGVVAPTQYSRIACAALFGALFFDEPLSAPTALGKAIIAMAGVLVVARPDRQNLPA